MCTFLCVPAPNGSAVQFSLFTQYFSWMKLCINKHQIQLDLNSSLEYQYIETNVLFQKKSFAADCYRSSAFLFRCMTFVDIPSTATEIASGNHQSFFSLLQRRHGNNSLLFLTLGGFTIDC